MKRRQGYLHYLIMLLVVSATAMGQAFTADTSYVKPRGRLLFAGDNPKPLMHLFDPQFDLEAAAHAQFGTFLPMLSVSPDKSKTIVIIRHAVDAHSYAVVDIAGGRWDILGGEAATVYWSADSKKAAVFERYLSDLQKIRVLDFSPSAILPYTVPDIIRPPMQSGKIHRDFKEIRWNENGSLGYEIVTTDSAGAVTHAQHNFTLPVKTGKE